MAQAALDEFVLEAGMAEAAGETVEAASSKTKGSKPKKGIAKKPGAKTGKAALAQMERKYNKMRTAYLQECEDNDRIRAKMEAIVKLMKFD